MSRRPAFLKRFCVCAMLAALSFLLSLWTPVRLPQGGTVTAASMVPTVFSSLLLGPGWGCVTAFSVAVLQLLTGLSSLVGWGLTPAALAGSILLDYLAAYTVIGLAGAVPGKRETVRAGIGVAAVCVLRYLCHVLSGWIFFGIWAEEGYSALGWSLFYNGTYMLPETVVTVVVSVLLSRALPMLRRMTD